MMKTQLILMFVFALLLSACAAPSPPQPTATSLPPDSIPSPVPPSPLPSTPESTLPPVQTEPTPTTLNLPATLTYTDDFAGFSIDYPAGWFLESSALLHAQESIGYNISIASWDILNPPTPSGKDLNTLPTGGTKIDVAVMKQSMTLEEAVAGQSQNEIGTPILARKDVTIANGHPAVILDVEGFAGLTRTLITILNGNVIYVSGYGNLENFETIALTLRPK